MTPNLPISTLSMSENALCDFVTKNSSGAHVKDSKTGVYILANQAALKPLGIDKLETFINFNVQDMDRFMRPYWGDRYAHEISVVDHKVISTGVASTKTNDVLLNVHNIIHVQDILKLPLISKNNKVMAILSILTDLTHKTDLFYLLDLYLSMHASHSIGIANFLKYLELDKFFHEDLTYKEISCLLHMRIDPSYKSTAKNLHISVKTVETHISHIIDKLKVSQLSTVLSHLRYQQNP